MPEPEHKEILVGAIGDSDVTVLVNELAYQTARASFWQGFAEAQAMLVNELRERIAYLTVTLDGEEGGDVTSRRGD